MFEVYLIQMGMEDLHMFVSDMCLLAVKFKQRIDSETAGDSWLVP